MIPISKLPDFDWNDVARQEIELSGEDIISHSDVAYRIRNVCVAGLMYESLLSPPWFWFALARGANHRDLLDFRRLKEHIPRGALTPVREGDVRCVKFAQLYGFEDTGTVQVLAGRPYHIFRRA